MNADQDLGKAQQLKTSPLIMQMALIYTPFVHGEIRFFGAKQPASTIMWPCESSCSFL
jgi:hypothetical protein